MSTLRIEAPELLHALSDASPEIHRYLDLRTGEVVLLFDDADGMEEEERLRAAVEEEPDRFRYIDPVPPHEGFRWMERFAHDVEDAAAGERLLDALDRPRPFRRFKDALLEFPELRESWFRYEEAQLRAYAEEWLRDEGIEAELVEPARAEPA